MTIATGTRVARKRLGVIHLARVVDGAVVMALCGNTLVSPRSTRLQGPPCPTCEALR